jgi:hypothetical protein
MRSVVLAVLGVVLLVVGVSLIYVPAGVICAGLTAILAAYVVRYLEVKNDATS